MQKYRILIFTIIFIPISVLYMNCGGESVAERVATLQEEARNLSGQAVAFSREGRENAAATRYREAIDVYIQILDLAPNSYEARLNLGILYNYFGDYDKAEESLEKARFLNEDNGRACFYTGSLFLNKGDPRQAELWFKLSIEKEPEYAPAYFFLGETKYDSKSFYEAKTAFETYIELKLDGEYAAKAQEYLTMIPEDIQPPIDAPILPSPPGTTPADTTASDEPESSEPDKPDTPTKPVPETKPEPKPEESEKEEQPEETQKPEQPKEPVKTEKPKEVEKPKETEQPKEAKPAETEKPKEVKPAEPKWETTGTKAPETTEEPEEPSPQTYAEWIESGRWAMALKDYNSAIEDFKEAYKLEPLFTEVNMLLGKVHRALGDLDKALDHLNIALNQSPDDTDSLLATAYCHEDKGDISKAIEYFERFLTIKDRDDIRDHVEELRGD